MNWRQTTEHLYKNINPVEGRIRSRMSDWHQEGKQFSSVWIEFDMNEFIYEDPFYGEQKSTDPFKMNIELLVLIVRKGIKELNELEDLMITNEKNENFGSFSNSLDVIPLYLKFGKIDGNEIDFEMTYSMVNSASYGMMDGTREDHLKTSGLISIKLKICDLVLHVEKENNLKKLLGRLDSNIYDKKSIDCIQRKSKEVSRSEYVLKYKNIKGKDRKKGWWPF